MKQLYPMWSVPYLTVAFDGPQSPVRARSKFCQRNSASRIDRQALPFAATHQELNDRSLTLWLAEMVALQLTFVVWCALVDTPSLGLHARQRQSSRTYPILPGRVQSVRWGMDPHRITTGGRW
jgi:hypothetical protein